MKLTNEIGFPDSWTDAQKRLWEGWCKVIKAESDIATPASADSLKENAEAKGSSENSLVESVQELAVLRLLSLAGLGVVNGLTRETLESCFRRQIFKTVKLAKSKPAARGSDWSGARRDADELAGEADTESELQTIVTLATAKVVPKTLARIVESLARTYFELDRAQRKTIDAMDDNAAAALYLLARMDTKESDSSVSSAIATFDARDALVRLAGGLIRPTELAERTGWSRQSILDWSNANRLLAVEDNGRRRYPRCQFDESGSILPGLDYVLGALASNGVRGWMALDFLFSIDPATGETPIALLRSGRIDEAVHSAKIFGEEGAA